MPFDEKIAVVVVTYNSGRVLPGLLDSLDQGLDGVSYRLIVADNDSTDDCVQIVRKFFPDARVVKTGGNRGYAAGINTAVAIAGDFAAVLVLNPDVRLGPGCVRELMSALRVPGTGIAVPRLTDGQGLLIESMRREPTVLRAFGEVFLGVRRAGRFARIGEIVSSGSAYNNEMVADWAEGSTQLISAECWDRCGPWDESYFLYSEEAEFDLRARDMGFATRYVPTAHATHLEGGTSPALWSLLVVNRVRLVARRRGKVVAVAFWFATLLREASRGLMGRRRSRQATKALLSLSRLSQRPSSDWIRMNEIKIEVE